MIAFLSRVADNFTTRDAMDLALVLSFTALTVFIIWINHKPS